MDHFSTPGYRRRIRIEPRPGDVTTALEDDIHCMAVTLHHDGEKVTAVSAEVERAPWNTCPGAIAVLVESFTGLPLVPGGTPGNKRQNCTHLYDLAEWGLGHALERKTMVYDLSVSDPVDGLVTAALKRDGELMMVWTHRDNVLISPAELAGAPLLSMRAWLADLPPAEREAARIIQWGSLVAHGRTMPEFEQGDAAVMPPNCYNFQPERALLAKRTGFGRDFSQSNAEPLSHFDGKRFDSASRRDD